MRTLPAIVLAAAVLSVAGCTVARAVPYIPDPVFKGITPEMARKALEGEMRKAHSNGNAPLESFTVGEGGLTFSYTMNLGLRSERKEVTVAYADCWPACATDLMGGDKAIPYAIQWYRGEEYVEYAFVFFPALEDCQTLIDAWAALNMAAAQPAPASCESSLRPSAEEGNPSPP